MNNISKETINEFSEIIKNCKYIISELNVKDYFKGDGIFIGICRISEDYIECNVIIKYGWPISNDLKIIRIPTAIIFDNEKIEKLINNTLSDLENQD